MSKYLLALSALLLSGCCSNALPPPMTNAEIIKAVKECKDAGLEASPMHAISTFSDDSRIRVIQCEPKAKEAQP